jgi:hypothetical protein
LQLRVAASQEFFERLIGQSSTALLLWLPAWYNALHCVYSLANSEPAGVTQKNNLIEKVIYTPAWNVPEKAIWMPFLGIPTRCDELPSTSAEFPGVHQGLQKR